MQHPAGLDAPLAAGWQALARFAIAPDSTGDTCDFFAAATRVQATLRAAGLHAAAITIAGHTAYLARKRNLADMSMLAAIPQPDCVLTREAIGNIAGALRDAPDPVAPGADTWPIEAEAHEAGVPPRVLALIKAAEAQLEGWCTREKSLAMARLILRERPRTCVEIGVYGGRSLVPCAAALEANDVGRIHGVESWDPAAAVSHPTAAENDDWWTRVDFPQIKRRFCRFVADQELTAQVCIIEAPSRRAASIFDVIDFLHIDGSHATIGAAEDVLLYATKVRSGGIIVFDDTDWDTTQPARQMLAALGQPMMTDAEVRAVNYMMVRRN